MKMCVENDPESVKCFLPTSEGTKAQEAVNKAGGRPT